MSALTVLVLQNADVLRAIRATPAAEIPTVTALAKLLGRDLSNFSKTLKLLNGSELIDVVSSSPLEIKLTPAGDAALAALARADGDDGDVPAGHVALRHDQIRSDPDNARTQSGLEDSSIDEIADSLRDKGMLQSPRVRPHPTEPDVWYLVMGERRLRGWGRNIERGDWPTDKRIICSIDDSDDAGRLEAGLVENLQRSDLNNLEAGEGFLTLATRHDRTPDQIAKVIGKTPRYVQIALKVAKEASPEDKARYVESERAYAQAKATGSEAKRAFTWENLRDEVRLPKHKAALDKNGRITLLVVELAHRLLFDDTTTHDLPGDWTEISAPPGGGYWAEAETLGLVEDNRASDVVLARLTEKARHWLTDRGFFKDPQGVLMAVRIEALGPMGETLAREEGRYATSFVNPPKRAPVVEEAPAADPAMLEAVTEELDRLFAADEEDEGDEEIDQSQTTEPRRRPPHPDEATDDTITPFQALVLGEILHKTRHKPTLMGEGLYGAALESPYPEMRNELKPLLWGGYLAETTIHRESGSVEILRVTETGERWLNQNQLNPLTNSNNLYTLQSGAKLRPQVSRVLALPWLNPPIVERPSLADRLAAAQGSRDQVVGSPALEAAMQELLDTRVDQAATPTVDQPHGPGFTNDEWIALVELAHKINEQPIEARGGAIIGALVGNYQSGPGAKVAQALIHKRMVGFVQAPSGLTFIAYLTPAASEHFDGEVGDVKLAMTHGESLSREALAAFHGSGQTYFTPWLITPDTEVDGEAPAEDAPAPELADEEEIAATEGETRAADDISSALSKRRDYLITATSIAGPLRAAATVTVPVDGEADGYLVGETLAQSGRFAEVTLHSRWGKLVVHWGEQ